MNKYAARALLEDLSEQGLKVTLRHSSKTLSLKLYTRKHNADIFLEVSGGTRNLFTVQSSQAGGGMGPLLYDLAMEYLTDMGNWMACDRWGSVSLEATHVWNQYLHRRQDVIKQQLTFVGTEKEIYNSIESIGYMSLYNILINAGQDERIMPDYGTLIHSLAGGMIRYPEKLEQTISKLLSDPENHNILINLLENEGTNYKYKKKASLIKFIDVYAEVDY